jgi:beta-lactam-binding protein with PASTA domain
VAGSATATYTYSPAPHCVVPKLKGKKLKAAKKALRKALCKIGIVKKLHGATAKTGRVVNQKPGAHKVLAPGAKVSVKLSD